MVKTLQITHCFFYGLCDCQDIVENKVKQNVDKTLGYPQYIYAGDISMYFDIQHVDLQTH